MTCDLQKSFHFLIKNFCSYKYLVILILIKTTKFYIYHMYHMKYFSQYTLKDTLKVLDKC